MTRNDDDFERSVSARLEAKIYDPADVAAAITVSSDYARVDETLNVTLDGVAVDVLELTGTNGDRLSILNDIGPGHLVIDYRATVFGFAPPVARHPIDIFEFTRPSRYCESDRIGPLARAEFAGLAGADLLAGVSSWVGANIAYVPGSSRPTDGAVATLLAREGVCRDFAHLTAALFRANHVPARVVAVYAPGLAPMDFHAVTEALIDGTWYVVDPTCLAPRDSMVRIATGADASEIAFLANIRGVVDLMVTSVSAVASELGRDDVNTLVVLR